MKSVEERTRLLDAVKILATSFSTALKGELTRAGEQGRWDLATGFPTNVEERIALGHAATDHHSRQPNVITFKGLRPSSSLSKSANRAIETLFQSVASKVELDEDRVPEHGALISFGAGYHIPLLLNSYATRDLVIVEPNFGVLCQVLADLDWQEIHDVVTARGGHISIVCNPAPVAGAMQAIAMIRRDNVGLIDGSRIVVGYRDLRVAETANAFMERRVNLVVYNGYVEDEDLLTEYAAGNLGSGSALSLEQNVEHRMDRPAVVVGSGTSLDGCYGLLRQVRNKVVIFSCGSALLALLENGIHPDVHCELEADPYIDDILRYTAQSHDLSGITLVASNTVYPAILKYFKQSILCFREGTLANRIFNLNSKSLPLIAPSCTNTGCSFAYALGFREIALCGVDLGSRVTDQHHAGSTVYEKLEDYNAFVGEDRVWMHPKSSASIVFDTQIAANFGGHAYTNDDMLQMRTSFELFAASAPDARLYNMSDGVLVNGFLGVEPKHYFDTLQALETTSTGAIESAVSLASELSSRNQIDLKRVSEFSDLLERWALEAGKIFADASRFRSSEALYDALKPLLQPDETKSRSKDLWDACRYAHTGSMLKVFHFIRYLDARSDQKQRRDLFHTVEETMPAVAREMTGVIKSRIDAILKTLPGV